MLGVISPSKESAITIPIGPMMMSAVRLPTMAGFSPVAPASAPAFSMAAVAMLLVPMARISSPGKLTFTCSTILFPILPPWPSITMIFIYCSILLLSIGSVTFFLFPTGFYRNFRPPPPWVLPLLDRWVELRPPLEKLRLLRPLPPLGLLLF